MQTQNSEPQISPSFLLALSVEMVVHLLPVQWLAREQSLDRQPALLTTRFRFNDSHHLGRGSAQAATQMGE